jgi:hypothetical protein
MKWLDGPGFEMIRCQFRNLVEDCVSENGSSNTSFITFTVLSGTISHQISIPAEILEEISQLSSDADQKWVAADIFAQLTIISGDL